MKKLTLLFVLVILFSCQKKEPTINWEDNKAFAEILDSAGEKFVMIDFVKDG